MTPDSVPSRTRGFYVLHKPNRYPSATGAIFPVTDFRTAFPLHSASHPVPCCYCNHLYWQSTLRLLCRRSPVRALPAVLRRHHTRTRSHRNTTADRFLLLRLYHDAHAVDVGVVMQKQQAVLAHHTINPFGIHGGESFIARLFS